VTLTGVWLRLELGRRWRSLAVLALLVAVCSAVVFAAAAGARRGNTAIERLNRITLPATAFVLPYDPKFDWTAVRALPEVAAVTTFSSLTFFPIDGVSDPYISGGAAFDGDGMDTIERPVVVAGRLADPARADEATVTSGFVTKYGFGVGDVVTARLYSAQQIKTLEAGSPAPPKPQGPVTRIRITGVVRSPWYSDGSGFSGKFFPTPALAVKYRANIIGDGSASALIRLRHGDADLARFREDLAKVSKRPDITVREMSEFTRRRQHSASFEAGALLAFAFAAAVASTVLIAQAVARHTATTVQDLRPLRAAGMTPVQALRTASAGPLLAGVAGGLLGVIVAGYASRWFPVGLVAIYEPNPGIDVDLLVLAAGLAVAVLVVAVGAIASAGFELAPVARRDVPTRRSGVVTLAARTGLPVPLVVGTRFALESGRVRSASARPALLGAIVGVAGVLGAYTFAAGVHDAAGNLARFGQTWSLFVVLGADGEAIPTADSLLDDAARDHDVLGVNDTRIGVVKIGDQALSTTIFSLQPVDRPMDIVLTEGRLPVAATDVVLGADTAKALGVRPGASIVVTGPAKHPQSMSVSGIGFVPQWIDNEYSMGGWVTGRGFEGLFAGYDYRFGAIQTRAGADLEAVQTRLATGLARAKGAEGITVDATEPVGAMDDVARVSLLPVLLGGFLALLAVGAVGHALLTGGRRRYELAVLRALGLTRRQVRAVVASQSAVLAVIGLAFGIPLGVALGRVLWRVVAAFMPLQYAPPLAVTTLLVVVPSALAVGFLLAAWPAHRAAGSRVADLLRAE